VTSRHRCRSRPEPVLAVEAFVREHPGGFRPEEVAAALTGGLEPSAVTEIIEYLLEAGRIALDDGGRLVRAE
jgi:hypothetical protein